MDALSNDRRPYQYRCARPGRPGFTVLELSVSMAIMGLLCAFLIPALMHAREAARRAVCTSHLREIGVAIHNYHNGHQRLPSAWQTADHDPEFGYGWAAQILPELEQQGIRQTLRFDRRPADSAMLGVNGVSSLALWLCPSDITEVAFALHAEDDEGKDDRSSSLRLASNASLSSRRLITLPTANYVGVFGTVEADDFQEFHGSRQWTCGDGSVIHDRRVRFADLRRGLSNTLLVGERTMATVPSTWLGVDLRGEDAPCRLVGSAMTSPNCGQCDECEFTSRHPGGSNFLWADGHVTTISDAVDTDLYRQFARRARQEARINR